MSYDPFTRGQFPVGVRTVTPTDASRQRALPVEVWYPATDAHAGKDTAVETRDTYELLPGFPPVWQDAIRDAERRAGRWPLVMFSHGYGGHRRQSTFLCTHLASHGYLVAAMDHVGNTVFDVMQMVLAVQSGAPLPDPAASVQEFIRLRPADVIFVIDELLAGGEAGVAAAIEREHIGMSGHSFGGWTTLMVTARDRRIGAALPLAPAGGSSPLPVDPLRAALRLDWDRDVPTLYLVADRDSLLPLPGMRELYAKTRGSKRFIVLNNADHMHFCDRVEEVHELFRSMPPPGDFERIAKSVPPIAELCTGEQAYTFVRGLGLAHFDAYLKGSEAAARFLAGDVRGELHRRGVEIDVVG